MSPILGQGVVRSTNISKKVGQCKTPANTIIIDDAGIRGDAHAGLGLRQVSLLSIESIRRFSTSAEHDFLPGEFAENITTEGIDLLKVMPLDRLTIGDAVLEITQIGKSCHGAGCAVFQQIGRCVMPKEGIFCRVITGGQITAGTAITHLQRTLSMRVITVSDRASRGECEDISGPRVRTHLESFFYTRPWHFHVEADVIPDEAEEIRRSLTRAAAEKAHIVVLTGGTGLGPRDVTPEVVLSMADKTVPGVMEHVRSKYGDTHPDALLSRSVAAVLDTTLVYALPGSPRAVDEYMAEIVKSLEHAVLMAHGLGH